MTAGWTSTVRDDRNPQARDVNDADVLRSRVLTPRDMQVAQYPGKGTCSIAIIALLLMKMRSPTFFTTPVPTAIPL